MMSPLFKAIMLFLIVILPNRGNKREGNHAQLHTVGAELNINSAVYKVFARA